MLLKHDIGTSLELSTGDGRPPLWKYVYRGKPKPYFHPMHTPAGHLLTIFEPHDHFWHRGLWFTIKFINQENFWEEHEPFGTQQTIEPPIAVSNSAGSVLVTGKLHWKRPNGETVIIEDRKFEHRNIDDRSYVMDMQFTLHPQRDLLLDRTVYTTWGGYGGLTFRGNRNWQETRLLFSDGTTSDRPTPKISKWCDLSGKFDGGINQTGGLAIFDHPSNPRHPTPWYGGTGPGHYFNAAFLFNEPMTVPAGKTLHFQYRVLVHDGIPNQAELEDAYQQYVAPK